MKVSSGTALLSKALPSRNRPKGCPSTRLLNCCASSRARLWSSAGARPGALCKKSAAPSSGSRPSSSRCSSPPHPSKCRELQGLRVVRFHCRVQRFVVVQHDQRAALCEALQDLSFEFARVKDSLRIDAQEARQG